MEVGLLYSGGKDSSLAALLLESIANVTLVCCTFGITDDYEHAMLAASEIGLPARRLDLDESVAREAAETIVEDGFPRNGIQQVHEHALETLASQDYDGIADGTRRDDRVPTVDRAAAQSLEDRHGISYLAPLTGIGRDAIDEFAASTLDVETGPSEAIPKGDYEAELRSLIAAEFDEDTVDSVFPDHVQSLVVGRQ
jgi:predicted subunit of tRNA(5-methylaminomethyl-2-thiouridylate) methyltransferase